jgi:hypothetical protein
MKDETLEFFIQKGTGFPHQATWATIEFSVLPVVKNSKKGGGRMSKQLQNSHTRKPSPDC